MNNMKEHGTVDQEPGDPMPDLTSDSDEDDDSPERFDGNTIWYHCEDNDGANQPSAHNCYVAEIPLW